MSDFQPPVGAVPGETGGGRPPPWTGRPRGQPPGVVASELLLGRSPAASIDMAYLDAYPSGFEFAVRATALPGMLESRLDVFGRHWPMVGDSRDEIPPHLLRLGVQFADGRSAMNIAGHDRPPAGPVMWPLHGGGGGCRFHHTYWVSPLPPSGPVALVCEWPAAGIPLSRREIDAQLILDAADRSRAIFPDERGAFRDGAHWHLGTDSDLEWITDGTSRDGAITAAIPPTFASYCTLMLPPDGPAGLKRHEQAVIELLSERTPEQPWWLGYLDTGAGDIEIVFPYAPRATTYHGYGYVLVKAGPRQAATWRDRGWNWALPDLMFAADRSWLVSTMWDDHWTCIGGPEELVSSFLRHPELGPRATRVADSLEK